MCSYTCFKFSSTSFFCAIFFLNTWVFLIIILVLIWRSFLWNCHILFPLENGKATNHHFKRGRKWGCMNHIFSNLKVGFFSSLWMLPLTLSEISKWFKNMRGSMSKPSCKFEEIHEWDNTNLSSHSAICRKFFLRLVQVNFHSMEQCQSRNYLKWKKQNHPLNSMTGSNTSFILLSWYDGIKIST